MVKKDSESKKVLLQRIRERFKIMVEADQENRRYAMEDLKFSTVPGAQWEENMKKERGDRPCYEFNKVRVTGKRIINEIRANRPSGKVRGVEGQDKDTAEIYEGLIRNIWNVSDGDTVIDHAAEYQVFAGMGAWRVETEYADDNVFDQDICLSAIPNPFCLYADPGCRDLLKRDAEDWLLTERISNKEFERKYGDAEQIDFESDEFDDEDEWQSDETTRIVEYWYKEPVEKEIWQLVDGTIVDSTDKEAGAIPQEAIRRRRVVNTNKIMMCIASGESILEGPVEWAGRHFPFVQVYGEYVIVDGKLQWYGIPRFAKDAQRSYNVSRTAVTETIAMAPQAKFWATPEQAAGHTDKWGEAHQKNFPFLLYNPDAKAPGAPQRMGGADVPVALIQESQLASQEIDQVTGIYEDDRGQESASQSGRAIYARQQQGRIATFNYLDNIGKGIQRTWEILVDLIPRVYDTEREIRVLGSDGVEDYFRVNTILPDPETGEPVRVNDLSRGRYDVTITIGPSFATRRQEAAETYQQLLQSVPDVFGVAGDLLFRSMDLPYAEDIAERLQTLLPPPIQQMINGDQQASPEAQAMMAQAEQAMAQVQQQMQMAQQMAAEAEQANAQNDKGKAEIQAAMSKLEAKQAKFEAQVAKQLATITEREAKLQVAEMEFGSQINAEGIEQAKVQLSEQVAGAVDAINQLTAAFMEQAAQTFQHIQTAKQGRKVRRITSKRENGQLVAIPEYEDDPTIQ